MFLVVFVYSQGEGSRYRALAGSAGTFSDCLTWTSLTAPPPPHMFNLDLTVQGPPPPQIYMFTLIHCVGRTVGQRAVNT